ncbi:transporter substrate-binding domain-containing protein [Rhodocyclus tenuis]|uniref:Transporter substrate-binding domain-containing protein n=1 Tax=Rhodocyclus gracilis TaxID=2929842 RepID=A0ABX0WFK4_9RHOO|nr:transporter substrate-binding domain-containing protein [Rhodocyclus gracilis]MRD71899.1 transporter substrate-binding domain-containing protein [Rhodocyclus gracilis]NJA87661.1 transporter substrate-binding domain-containing protein [Rhodocyclus gracilis]
MNAKLYAVIAVLVAGWSVNTYAGETLNRIKTTKTLVEVVDQSYPPFSFLNDKNQMDGFDIDVAKEVAKRLGARLKIETPSWEVVTAGNWRGRWDVCICSMTPDKQKARVLDFVAHYYSAPAVLVTADKNSTITSEADINARRIGVEQGSSYERYLQKGLVIEAPDAKPIVYPFDRVTIAPYGSEDLAYQDLALGAGKRIDGIVSNLITAKARIAKTPGKFKLIGSPLYLEPNWVAIDKGDAEWKAELARILAELKKDGTLSKLSQKWIGQDITQ